MTDVWKLTTLNVNGLRSATRKGFAEWRTTIDSDVLLLQELRMQVEQLTGAHAPPPGYAGIASEAEKKGYSGVAAWTRLPVRHQTRTCGIPLVETEGRWAQVETPEATLVSLYLPSGTSGPERQAVKDTFSEDLLGVLDRLSADGAPVAVCGDFNVAHTENDIHNPRGNAKNSGFLPHEREWFSRMLARGWVDLYRHLNPTDTAYSWWSNRGQARANDKGWRIDYILCTPSLAARATACWIEGREPALSDHCAVHATFRRQAT